MDKLMADWISCVPQGYGEVKTMSRYIDADALEYDTEWSEYHDGFTAYSQMAIDTAPSIDIVRCKECEHRKKNGFCLEHNRYEKNDNGYCSYGEREVE